jgi:cell wall-associated NlpC family hydrolase
MTHRRAFWLRLLVGGLLVTGAGCVHRQPRVRVLPPVSPPEEAAAEAAPPEAVAPGLAGSEAAETGIVRTAMSVLGAPYRDGGALPDGFDCSGLVTWVFARLGIAVPRDVRQQAAAGAPVPRAAIRPGDLLFFSTTGPGPTHVAIAIGGDRFIHAPRSGAVVRIESLSADYWAARFILSRRLLVGSGY